MKDSVLSIMTDTLQTDTVQEVLGSELPMIPRVETMASSSWFGIMLIFILVAFATAFSIHQKQYIQMFRHVFSTQGRMMRYDTEHTEIWANILLWTIVILSHSLCIFSIAQIKMETMLPFWIFLVINLCIISLLLLKWGVIKIISYIFSSQEKSKLFITDYFVLIAFWGLLLIPCSIALVYSTISHQNIWIIVIFVLAIFMFIAIIAKLVQFFYRGISSLFYIFLYLCILEILPITIMLKIASEIVV